MKLSVLALVSTLVGATDTLRGAPTTRALQQQPIGKYDPSKDHLEVHFDLLWDIDDCHCVGALRMLFDYYGIDATVIAGTASPQKQGGFAPFGNEIGALDMAFAKGVCNVQNSCAGTTSQVGWVNADADWDHNPNAPLVAQIGGMWKSALERGGEVWIMEGGMGDFTLDVAEWVRDHSSGLNLKRIHSVQHSNWNIDNSGSGVYNTLPNIIDHIKISDGNGKLNSNIGGNKQAFVSEASNGIYASLWDQIWKGDGGWQKKIDFSDTVEMLYILEKMDMVENYDRSKEPWENYMTIYNRFTPVGNNPTPAPTPRPTSPSVGQTPPPTPQTTTINATPSPTSSPGQCGIQDFQNECSTTGQCQSMYPDATDCDNSKGGVCFCSSTVCGCSSDNNSPPTTPNSPIDLSCFPASALVDVQGKGLARMDELKIGDYVRSNRGEFSQVHGFYHLDRLGEATYLKIQTDNGKAKPLEISGNHLVFRDQTAVPAKHIRIGDKLGDSTVTAIEPIQDRGIYSPATFSGSIVVNGVLASTYTSQLKHAPVNEHIAVHVVLSYHRLACMVNFRWCENETHTLGLSNMNLPLIKLVRTIDTYGAAAQVTAVVIFLPLFGMVYAVEQMVLCPMLAALVAVAGYILCTKSKKSKLKLA